MKRLNYHILQRKNIEKIKNKKKKKNKNNEKFD